MAEYSAVWNYLLCAREMAKFHGLISELGMPLISRDDMIQMSFSQSFITVLEVVAGEDVNLFDLSVSSSFFFSSWCCLIFSNCLLIDAS